MGLETATYISELVASNPVGAVDDYATADDHLRLIKDVLQSQFPNLTAGAVLTTQAELNILDTLTAVTADLELLSGADAAGLTAAEILYLNGVTSDIQTQLDDKPPNARDLIAGIAIAGGGDLSADRTFDFDGTSLGTTGGLDTTDELFLYDIGAVGYFKADIATLNAYFDHDSLAGALAAEHIDWAVTGAELIHVDRLTAADIEGIVAHDNLQSIPANDHIDHSTVDVTAGSFLSGGGDLTATRTLDLDFAGESNLSAEITAQDEFLYSDGGTLKKGDWRHITTPITSSASTSYTTVEDDSNSLIKMTAATAITFNIATNASVTAYVGTIISVMQYGAGQITFQSSDTLRVPQGTKSATQYGITNLIKINTTEWVAVGDLEV